MSRSRPSRWVAVSWAARGLARRLLGYAGLRPGEKVLDVATGTGLVALPAARLVLPSGFVTGIDLSDGMLSKARENAAELGLTNVTFGQADADTLERSS